MHDSEVPTEALLVVELVAGAIRDELGDEIDAYPGCSAPEQADPINRAFQATVLSLIENSLVSGDSPAAAVSRALRRVAERRLAADGFDARRSRLLIDVEPGSPDDWLTFLILSSRTQVEHALKPEESGLD